MSKDNEGERGIRRDDDNSEFVDRLAESYSPAPLSPARRVALENALWERIERRRTRRFLVPALSAGIAVAALVWFVGVGGVAEAPPMAQNTTQPIEASVESPATRTPPVVAQASGAIFDFEWEETGYYDDALPDDYLAISDVFFSG